MSVRRGLKSASRQIAIIILVPFPMKHLLLFALFVFLLSPFVSLGQGNNDYMLMRAKGTAKVKHFTIEQPKTVSEHQNVNLERIRVDDSLSLLFNNEGTFLYLGAAKQTKNGRWFPDGKGLCREVVYDPKTGASGYRYSLCLWKRGSRNGEGVLQLEDESICKAVWKWNKLKKTIDEYPMPDDIDRMRDYQNRLETLLKLMGN